MVRIVLPSVWSPDGATTFEVREGSLYEVIGQFVAEHPDYGRRLLDSDAKPFEYVNYCVDDTLIPRAARAETLVAAGQTVTVLSPMAGG